MGGPCYKINFSHLFHESKDLKSLLDLKTAFEAFASKFGVTVQSNWADNAIYAADAFKSVCTAQKQDLTHCAVGGHWQNAIAERTIGFVTQTARTILLHAMVSWPMTVTKEFWTFAVRHACTFHNASIRVDTKKSSHHMFTGSIAPWKLQDFWVFGSLAPKSCLLSSIWSYRRKRLPNGKFLKYKSCLCVNGKEQAFGRDYWKMYAPVASWATIHMMLILSSILDLKVRQVDYTQAFPQAALDDPVFMQIPQGWYIQNGILHQHTNPKHNDTTHYIKLKRNLHGCNQAARNRFQHLTKGLLHQGFMQSKTNSCLFLRHDCVLVKQLLRMITLSITSLKSYQLHIYCKTREM